MASKLRSIERARAQKQIKELEGDIEITYSQLIDANDSGAIHALLNQRFPGRLMQLIKFGQKVAIERKNADEARQKIIEQHGGIMNGDNSYNFPDGQMKLADADYREVLETKITIKAPRFTAEERASLEHSSLTPAQGLQLIWLIEEN